MPKATFFNLPKTKQQQFIKIAFEEFALQNYHQASITKVVQRMGIAKGSVYQYFENKKDLYFYLIEVAGKMRNKASESINGENISKDFFYLVEQNLIGKVLFDLDHPTIAGFLANVMQEKNSEELGNIQLITKRQTMAFVENLIHQFRKTSRIRKDIDDHLLAYYVVQTQWGIYDYLEMTYNINFRQYILGNKPVYDLSEDQIKEVVASFMNLLKDGMRLIK
jgi:TetR/AcrR family transcriptional regulator